MVQITPKISATEAAALEAGTIGFDRDIFDGTASLDGLKKKYPLVSLNEREQKFIDNEVRGFPAGVPHTRLLPAGACPEFLAVACRSSRCRAAEFFVAVFFAVSFICGRLRLALIFDVYLVYTMKLIVTPSNVYDRMLELRGLVVVRAFFVRLVVLVGWCVAFGVWSCPRGRRGFRSAIAFVVSRGRSVEALLTPLTRRR